MNRSTNYRTFTLILLRVLPNTATSDSLSTLSTDACKLQGLCAHGSIRCQRHLRIKTHQHYKNNENAISKALTSNYKVSRLLIQETRILYFTTAEKITFDGKQCRNTTNCCQVRRALSEYSTHRPVPYGLRNLDF